MSELINKKILNLSIDSKLFEENSAVSKRFIEYGKLVSELHVVVYTKKGFIQKKLVSNVYLYPTNTSFKFNYFFDALRLAKKILTSDMVITSQEAFTHMVGIMLKKKYGNTLELQYHTDFMSPYFKMESIKNYARYLVYCWSIKYADVIRVVSERVKKSIQLKNIDQSLIRVEPIVVDVEKIKNTIPSFDLHKKYSQFDKIILMISRLEQEKDIVSGIKAFSEVLKEFPKTGLVVVGSGSQRSYLQNISNSSIIFEDWQNDTVSYYKTADIFLNTSRYEGYGITLIEASMCKIPIVTTDVGIVDEIISKGANCRVCPVGDIKCLANKLKEALNSFLR
ncbi:MAG: glycosyltransferase [Candidatus Taylorbacteria bacterium]|nr:glycosyltransferase [Candidatus Taylorbacteria bacterium]